MEQIRLPERDQLLRGGSRELVTWMAEPVAAAMEAVGLHCDLQVSVAEDQWSIRAVIDERPVLLVDADSALDQDSLDRLELRAGSIWRDVTRNAGPSEPRPWVGTVRVVERSGVDQRGVERLTQLVASRTLDAACVVMVDSAVLDVWSPIPALSIESYQAALIGRCLVLAAGAGPAR